MSDERDKIAELEGRMRGLEALLLQMPEVTPDRIRAARELLERNAAAKQSDVAREVRARLRPKAVLDEHGDNALRDLLHEVGNRSSQQPTTNR